MSLFIMQGSGGPEIDSPPTVSVGIMLSSDKGNRLRNTPDVAKCFIVPMVSSLMAQMM